MVTWDTIECIERNGIITGYTVVFQEQGGANVPGNTVDRTFSAGELTPGTNYIFQVAGVNDVGTGPFINVITITTCEDGSYINGDRLGQLLMLCTHSLAHTSTWCSEHHVRCYIHIATRHIECSSDCTCVVAEFFKTSE